MRWQYFTKDQLIYHRGKHSLDIKENSPEAMSAAIKDGAAWIEFDVVEDQKVAHDRGAATDTLRLPEALAIIGGQASVNIEIKCPSIAWATVATVFDAIASGIWRANQFLISSFHHPTILGIKDRFPSLHCGIIMDAIPDLRMFDIAKLVYFGIDNIHIETTNARADAMSGYHFRNAVWKNSNTKIWVWTVNDQKDAHFILHDYRAEKIFTDTPDAILGA